MLAREMLSYFPSNNMEDPADKATDDPEDRADIALNSIVPASSNQAYDIKKVIGSVVDDGTFLEVHEHFAKNIVVGFARLGRPLRRHRGEPAGRPGRVPRHRRVGQGRALRPVLRLLQHPARGVRGRAGVPPGTDQEFRGIILHGAKLLYAFAEATVPKLTVITRKAYGGAYCVMASKHIRADFNYAWPSAEIAVMGSEGAVNIIHRGEHRSPRGSGEAAVRAEKVAEYQEKFANPYVAAERGYVDEVIEPALTRRKLIGALRLLKTKRDANPPRKHGNIPL